MSRSLTFFLICYLLLTSLNSLAQDGGMISGIVKNKQGEALSFANVSLLAPDSSVIENTFSDSIGAFRMAKKAAAGKYLIKVIRLGYLPYYSDANIIDAGLVLHISLSENKQELKEVSVSASKQLFEKKTDRIVFNVENSIVLSGENLIDILKQSPGVVVDGKENIMVNGKTGVEFMIDDKLVYMSGEQLSNYLRSFSASNIKSIEIITNPSTKYDAAGTAGIINIVTKKKRNKGLNGDLNVTGFQGKYAGYTGSLNLNYKRDKINLLCSFNSNDWTFMSDQQQSRQINDATIPITFQQSSFMKNPDFSNDLKLGLDWDLERNQSLSISVWGLSAQYPGSSIQVSNAYKQASPSALDSYTISKDFGTEPVQMIEANVHYTKDFDTSGRKLSIDYVFTAVNDHASANYAFSYFNPDGSVLKPAQYLNANNPSQNNINVFKADYAVPVGSIGKLEMGLKASFISNDNNNIFSQGNGNIFVVDSTKTNHFVYTENINALYLNWSKEAGDNSFQAGLRAEQTNSNGNSVSIAYTFKRSYIDLFPSAGFQHSFNDNNQLSFSYSRRISRPDYSELNPFLYYLDAYAYQQGNPFLRPELADVFEVGYVFQKKYSITYNFSSAHDVNYDASIQNDTTKVLINSPINLGHSYNHAVVFTIPIEATKWWHIDGNYGLSYNIYIGTIQNTSLDRSAGSFTVNISNNFKLPHSYSFQLSGYYHAPSIRGYENFAENYNISAGFKKQVLKGKGTLKLALTDIFYTQRDYVTVNFDNQQRSSLQQYDSRKLRLSFIYNFARGIEFSRREIEAADDDERSRLKQK